MRKFLLLIVAFAIMLVVKGRHQDAFAPHATVSMPPVNVP